MKFTRDDYTDRIVDRAGLIPDDEPAFLLRGQDRYAPDTLEHYAKLIKGRGASDLMVLQVRLQAEAMRDYQRTKKMKTAPDMDLPPPALELGKEYRHRSGDWMLLHQLDQEAAGDDYAVFIRHASGEAVVLPVQVLSSEVMGPYDRPAKRLYPDSPEWIVPLVDQLADLK
jgi:hypothetical protein